MVLSLGPDGLLILDGPDDRVLARGGVRHRLHGSAHFADGDLLLAQTARHLWSYRLAGRQLKVRASAKNQALFGPALIPDLGAVAVTGPRGVRLLALAALAAAPMTDMTAADIVTTADLLDDPATASAVRPFLELLRECLACRFRAGERSQGGVRDDEIDIHNGSGGRP